MTIVHLHSHIVAVAVVVVVVVATIHSVSSLVRGHFALAPVRLTYALLYAHGINEGCLVTLICCFLSLFLLAEFLTSLLNFLESLANNSGTFA